MHLTNFVLLPRSVQNYDYFKINRVKFVGLPTTRRSENRDCLPTPGRARECKGLMGEQSRARGDPPFTKIEVIRGVLFPVIMLLHTRRSASASCAACIYVRALDRSRVHVNVSVCLGLLHSIRDIPHSSHTCKNTSVGTRCSRCLTLIRTAGLRYTAPRHLWGRGGGQENIGIVYGAHTGMRPTGGFPARIFLVALA